jgi:hypothetical protein
LAVHGSPSCEFAVGSSQFAVRWQFMVYRRREFAVGVSSRSAVRGLRFVGSSWFAVV